MQNIVGAFKDLSSAQLALHQLQSVGLPLEQLHFKPSPDLEFLARARKARQRPGHPGYRAHGVLESIGDFFANLFESHTDESGIYGDKLEPGSSLVLVEAQEGAQAQRVIRILQDCGARSLEDHVGQWRLEGWEDVPGPSMRS